MLRSSASAALRARRLVVPALARATSPHVTRTTTTIPSPTSPPAPTPAPQPRAADPPPDRAPSADQPAPGDAATEGVAAGATKRVDLTDACAARLRELRAARGTPVVLRVTVDAGGCSGFQYTFGLEDWAEVPRTARDLGADAEANGDAVFVRDDVAVIVDALSLEYLQGAKIDYKTELISSSFRVADNPNSEASCGCGVSFAPKLDD